jgi:hypothetical protein
MTLDAIPPDGLIARVYVESQETMSEGAREYMRACLLRGMRGEALPPAKRTQKLTDGQAADVRARVRRLLPEIEEIRAGEIPLPRAPAPAPTQETIPF